MYTAASTMRGPEGSEAVRYAGGSAGAPWSSENGTRIATTGVCDAFVRILAADQPQPAV